MRKNRRSRSIYQLFISKKNRHPSSDNIALVVARNCAIKSSRLLVVIDLKRSIKSSSKLAMATGLPLVKGSESISIVQIYNEQRSVIEVLFIKERKICSPVEKTAQDDRECTPKQNRWSMNKWREIEFQRVDVPTVPWRKVWWRVRIACTIVAKFSPKQERNLVMTIESSFLPLDAT